MTIGEGGPTRSELVEVGSRMLAEAGIEAPRSDAQRLLAHVLGLTPGRVALTPEHPVAATEEARVATLLSQRVARVPLQHLEGTVQFRDIELVSDARALIPRPETEQLVDLVARWASRVCRTRPTGASRGGGSPLSCVLDIGTGSGAIALSLLAEGVAERTVGLDVSDVALEQARVNRTRVNVGDRLELRECGWNPYEALRPGERFDAIVSNPPYIRTAELAGLAPEVRLHDPLEALAGGEDGLEVIRQVARGAYEFLAPEGGLFLEIGCEQGNAVRDILDTSGAWSSVEIRRDHADRERFAIALA